MSNEQTRDHRALVPSNRQLPGTVSVITRGVRLAEAIRFAEGSNRSPSPTTTALVKRGIALGERLLVSDRLTQLYNTVYLNLALRRESKRALRLGRPLSLVFIDLDGFKEVHDSLGDLLGGRVLVAVAAVIRGSTYETNVVAHLDDGEFAILMPDTGQETAFVVGERVRQRIAANRFQLSEAHNIQLTASVGLATLPDAVGSANELVDAADKATCSVKASGGNGVRAAISSKQP
ncbi:MAG TPA: GGDEF domain-containing protein [Blastocatellia bacterium]|nr:GGDEF domain-containing protein [Blastocatellia bacterium]